MITPKPLGNALRLEVADDPLPGALTSMVSNPSGEQGGWGWLTPVTGSTMSGTTAVAGGPYLLYTSPGTVASYFTTESMPVVAGRYVAASLSIKAPESQGWYRMRLDWLDAAQALLSSSTQSGYLNAGASLGPYQAPASTAYVRLRIDHFATNTGAVPTAGLALMFNQVTVAQATTSAALGTSKTNLVPNPSFETDLSGWVVLGTGVTGVRDTAQHQDGVASAHLTNANTSVRTNLVTNPSFEVNTTGWTAIAATIARDTTGHAVGTASLRVTNTTQSTAPGASIPATAIVAGQSYTISVWALVGTAFKVQFTSTGGVFPDSPRYVSNGSWQRYSYSFVADANGTGQTVRITFSIPGPLGLGDLVGYLDAALLEQSTSMGTYFDGATANTSLATHAWTGTAHASTSTETGKVAPTGNPGMLSPKMTVVGGAYYTLSAYVKQATTSPPGYVYLGWTWWQGNTAIVQARMNNATALTDTNWRRFNTTQTAPVNADGLSLTVGIDFGDALSSYWVDAAMVEQGQTLNPFYTGTVSTSNLAYVEPIRYVNVLGTTHDITITREALNVGTLSAHVVDSSLDPSQDTLIRPGRATRLTAYDAVKAMWRPVFTGTATHATVEYDLAQPNAAKRAKVELTAVDHAQALANQNRAEGVGTIAELPFVLEGCAVPWNVNGSGNQVGTAVVVANNDSASALDQVSVTRDSVLGYAWVDRRGVLQVWDKAKLSTTLAGAELAETSYRDVVVGFDSDSLINEVNIRFMAYDPNTGETNEVNHGPYRNEISIAQWGVHSAEFAVQGLNDDETSLTAYANSILTANATPVVRLNSMDLTVDLSADWSSVAAASWWAFADLYDLAQVTCARASISKAQARITGIQHTISGPDSKWTTQLLFNANSVVASPTFTPSPTGGAGGLTIGQLLRPVGEVTMWYGTKAAIPSGWLACDGTTFDGAAYPDLQVLLGGTTLPNLTDRMPVGAGTKALGTAGGNATHALTVAELPAHSHTNSHTHTLGIQYANTTTSTGSSVRITDVDNQAGGGGNAATATTSNASAATGSTGSGTPVDIVPPWRALWFLIRAR